MPAPVTFDTFRLMMLQHTDDCQPWPHALSDSGYPIMTHPSGERYAHRAALLETVGPCPDGMEAAHLCGTRSCINSDHLRWATPSDNNYDRSAHGTMPRGHQHHWGVLDDETVREIIRRHRSGESSRALAAEYGVSRPSVDRWSAGLSRAHLTRGE